MADALSKKDLKIFLSGPMTGLPNYNFDRFNEVEKKLKDAGFDVVNPVVICERFGQENVVKDKRLFDAMVARQQVEERKCNAVLLLDGWQSSKGVRLELDTALKNGFKIFLESDFADVLGKIPDEETIHPLIYESLRDKALDMAWTLRKIDRELSDAAQFEGDHPGGYPSENLLPALCKIMYASQQYHTLEELKTYAEKTRDAKKTDVERS